MSKLWIKEKTSYLSLVYKNLKKGLKQIKIKYIDPN